MFTRVYMLCILISANDSGLLFLMVHICILLEITQNQLETIIIILNQ